MGQACVAAGLVPDPVQDRQSAGGDRVVCAGPGRVPLRLRWLYGCGGLRLWYWRGGIAEVTAAGGVHGFPAELTSFIGRAGPVREVAGLLAEYRLVTVTGPGGSGKTRLAGEVARRVADRFADGAWLAELAPVRDPAQVAGGGGGGAGGAGAAGGAGGRGAGAGAGPAAVAAGAG